MKRKILHIVFWVGLGILISDLFYRYCFELLAVPTSSMQETIEAGDYVWVNKLIPGPRFRSHHPDKYRRLRVSRSLDYGDVIVFNFPEADTIIDTKPGESYYLLRQQHPNLDSLLQLTGWGTLKTLEVKNRPRMVKRIVGLPGDTMEIRNGLLHINGIFSLEDAAVIHTYQWLGPTDELNSNLKQAELNATPYARDNKLYVNLSDNDLSKLGDSADYLRRETLSPGIPDPYVYPYRRAWGWNADNMGPVYLPRKGDTILLNQHNFHLYGRMIRVFENANIEIKGNYFYINNIPVSRYTFKLDYYWTHGDNRPRSFDSRYWGPVPENHIVGIIAPKKNEQRKN